MRSPRSAPLFLVGAQRSGTTALGVIVSAAVAARGGIFTVNGKLIYYLMHWWLSYPADRHARADEIVYALRRRPPLGSGIPSWLKRCDEALGASAQSIAQQGDATDCVSELRSVCATAYGDGLWGDKYNEYLLHLPTLDRLFPDATWLFVAREPRQVVASMLEWAGDRAWNPTSQIACALKWRTWNEHWLLFRDSLPPVRRIEFLYGSPLNALSRRLVETIGIDLMPFADNYQPRPLVEHASGEKLPRSAQETWDRITAILNRQASELNL